MSNQSEENTPVHREISWRSPEILGEAVLLGVVLLLAITSLVEMPGLKMAGRYLPIVTLIFAAPFWFIRVKTLFDRKRLLEAGQIMDLGFRFGGNAVAEKRRAIRFITAVAVLFLSIWALGFHLALPIWVVTYLFLFAKVKPIAVLLIALAFEGLLLGVHDFIINVPWPEPLLWRMIGVEYLFNEWPVSGTY
jgi:hypothetical protein